MHIAGGSTFGIGCWIQNVFAQLNLTTLCAGAFSSVSDSLFEAELETEEAEARLGMLSALSIRTATRFSPMTFARREREMLRVRRPYAGISRDMQKRLKTSERGRVITDFVDHRRAELLTLFAKDGDVRRATLAAIRPLVANAATTTEVLGRKVTGQDLERLEMLGKELMRKGDPKLQESLKKLMTLKPKEGVTLAEALEIDL
jgi:hypothetical protein